MRSARKGTSFYTRKQIQKENSLRHNLNAAQIFFQVPDSFGKSGQCHMQEVCYVCDAVLFCACQKIALSPYVDFYGHILNGSLTI